MKKQDWPWNVKTTTMTRFTGDYRPIRHTSQIFTELRFANYNNDEGAIVCNPTFIKLKELANAQQGDAL